MKKCKCIADKQTDKYFYLLNKYKLSEKDRKFFENIYQDLINTKLNYEVDEAILDGSWPSAFKYLERGLYLCYLKDNFKKGEE